MNYMAYHNRHISLKRIEKRHKSFRNPHLVGEKYELIQRIIIFMIIISCIALVATAVSQF
jgi:hypothetical protein